MWIYYATILMLPLSLSPSLSLAFHHCYLRLQWQLPSPLSLASSRPASLSRSVRFDSIFPSTASTSCCIGSIISGSSRSRVNGLGPAHFRDTPTRRIWFNSVCCMLLILFYSIMQWLRQCFGTYNNVISNDIMIGMSIYCFIPVVIILLLYKNWTLFTWLWDKICDHSAYAHVQRR